MSGNIRLTDVAISNFKRIQNVEIPLAPITILVGPNGSGKSAVLQALHMAACLIRQASRTNRSCTISLHEADYIPTEYTEEVGYLNRKIGNLKDSPCVKVKFHLEDECYDDLNNSSEDLKKIDISIEIRRARNHGISMNVSMHKDLKYGIISLFRPVIILFEEEPKSFTAYVPGLSGIRISETVYAPRAVWRSCSFGDANAYLRNVLLMLKKDDKSHNNLKFVEEMVKKIFCLELFIIDVNFDEEKDFNISCIVNIDGCEKPIELLGTGFLQAMQIFAYIAMFRPKLLLLDEPDIHLHPTVQERLLRVLREIAEERGMRVLIATHSPFIVRGAPADSQIHWLDGGKIKSTSRRAIEFALGWGVAGKKILLFTEDRHVELLKLILGQWPVLESLVAVHPGSGYRRLPTPEEARQLYETLGRQYKILIHRDRDAMTQDEVDRLTELYEKNNNGVYCWITDKPDIESYFCDPKIIVYFINELNGTQNVSEENVELYIKNEMRKRLKCIKEQFRRRRKEVIKEIWPEGGGIDANTLIKSMVEPWEQGKWGWALGKEILKIIDNQYVRNNLSGKIPNFGLPKDITVAESLRAKIDKILSD